MGRFITFLIMYICLMKDSYGFLFNLGCGATFCLTLCQHGYELVNGCPTCKCKPAPTTATKNSMSGPDFVTPIPDGPMQGGGSFNTPYIHGPQINIQGSSYHNPCVPSQAYCVLNCVNFVTGANGCQYCLCDHSVTATTHEPSTLVHHSIQLSNPCIPAETTCDKSCQNGFLIGPNNCEYCLCSQYKQIITTTIPTTPEAVVLPNACFPSQKCNMQCSHGYAHGPSGCQYCLCAPEGTQAPTTHAPKIAHSNDTMSEQCVIATAICQVKCQGGFMTDRNDCTFCTCKGEIEKALHLSKPSDPIIKLMKPCVQEFDICNIFCAQGYLRGPDNCQFCACSH